MRSQFSLETPPGIIGYTDVHEIEHPRGVILKREDEGAELFEKLFPAPEFDVETVRCVPTPSGR